ncbi:hypothetical protein Q3G72_019511 [Acer saccharum]|nr:hypothetical protein Q3G72_019511 [Acer saccharum]
MMNAYLSFSGRHHLGNPKDLVILQVLWIFHPRRMLHEMMRDGPTKMSHNRFVGELPSLVSCHEEPDVLPKFVRSGKPAQKLISIEEKPGDVLLNGHDHTTGKHRPVEGNYPLRWVPRVVTLRQYELDRLWELVILALFVQSGRSHHVPINIGIYHYSLVTQFR